MKAEATLFASSGTASLNQAIYTKADLFWLVGDDSCAEVEAEIDG